MAFEDPYRRNAEDCAILMFHRVEPLRRCAFGLPSSYRIRGTSLTPGELEAVLDGLDEVVSLEEVEDALSDGRPPPSGWVLTFDDGYREHLDLVAPSLARRGWSATFYVLGGAHGLSSQVPPVDAWYFLLDHAERPRARMTWPGGRGFELRLDELEGKRAWVMGAPKQAFLEAEPEKQAVMLEALAHAVGVDLPPALAGSLLLRPEEWTELRALGHRLGAHGMTHARLSGLSAEDLEAEVVASIRHVRAIEPRVAFAYPDGAHDESSRAAVCAAGASSAVTCEHGVLTTRTCRFRLPRRFARPPRGP